MKKPFVVFGVGISVLLLTLTAPVFSEESQDQGPTYGGGPGYMMGPGNMMGRGDWSGGPMMGPGYGQGMYGRGRMMDRGWGCDQGFGAREAMKPEQRAKWEKMWSNYQMETLELRQQLATRQIELDTLWAQPDMDNAKIEKLSGEVAQLQAELAKKHDKYLLQCRGAFGDQGWNCPGRGW